MNLKWEDHGIKTTLARARGLGAAHEGTGEWLALRVSAIALVPLSLWMVYSVLSLAGSSHHFVVAWLAQPLNAILSILFVLASFFHARLGVKEIIEDYVHHEGLKIFSLIVLKLLFIALAVVCVFSILKVAL